MAEIRPEWAMVGWQADGQCWLLASRELSSAQLDWVRRTYEFASWEAFLTRGAFRPAVHIDIVSEGRWTIVKAATYAECLADLLFKHGWRADAPAGELPTHDPIRGFLAARRVEKMIEAEVVDG